MTSVGGGSEATEKRESRSGWSFLLVAVYKTSGAYNGNALGVYTIVITLYTYGGGVISVT